MLFFFRGRNGLLVRAIVGALFVLAGIATDGALLVGIGVVLLVWGGVGTLRSRRPGPVGTGGRIP
jgi:hypothetical protein